MSSFPLRESLQTTIIPPSPSPMSEETSCVPAAVHTGTFVSGDAGQSARAIAGVRASETKPSVQATVRSRSMGDSLGGGGQHDSGTLDRDRGYQPNYRLGPGRPELRV